MSYDAAGQQEKDNPEEGSQEEAGQEEPQGFEPGYTGSFYDHEAGLVYLNARFYSPQLGCFLSEDTVEGNEEELMTLNRYAYCKQDPVNYTDPSGHWSTKEHKEISNDALAVSGYRNSKQINECVALCARWADTEFHYSDKRRYALTWSDGSRKRLKLKNLQGYCNESYIDSTKKFKKNKYGSPYHGRGEYYTYLPYLLGLSLQFQKGYMINNLVLRNDNLMYQQMNFDMLIHLSGLYEIKKKKTISRMEYSYLILGIAIHLVEDMWAHVAVINDSELALDKYAKYFDVGELEELETLLRNKQPICYLNMFNFCQDKKEVVNGEEKTYYDMTHRGLAEGAGWGAQMRRNYAGDAAIRLLGYYNHGYIMHSGNQKLGGANQANRDDRKRLGVSKCPSSALKPITIILKNGRKVTYGQYICNVCENGKADSCYQIYCYGKGKGKGLGYMPIQNGDVK